MSAAPEMREGGLKIDRPIDPARKMQEDPMSQRSALCNCFSALEAEFLHEYVGGSSAPFRLDMKRKEFTGPVFTGL